MSPTRPPEPRSRRARRPSAVFTEHRPEPPEVLRVARALARQLRSKQWVKNLACLAGLIFSGLLFSPAAQAQAGLALVAFCLASSCVYIVNDLVDREHDRHNPRTAKRPLASGELPVGVAVAALNVMLGGSVAVSAYLGTPCLVVVATYAAQGVWYSLSLKRVVIVDVMCIASGFVLRVLYGVYAVGVLPTPWIVLCMFFLALFLGFAKRQAELNAAGGSHAARPVLGKYRGDYLQTLIMISATTTILAYALFTVTSHKNPTLAVTVVPVVYCICRYLLQVMVAGRGESPDETLVRDRRMLLGIAVWVVLFVVILYGDIRLFADPR